MNRRAFLQALAATGIVASIPLSAIPEEIPTHLEPRGPNRTARLSSFYATGRAATQRFAQISVARSANGPGLLNFHLNAQSGGLRYQAPPGHELFFVGGNAPNIRCEDPDVDWHLVLHDENGFMDVIGRSRGENYALRVEAKNCANGPSNQAVDQFGAGDRHGDV